MKIGILALAAGRNAGGPEVYEVNIVRALAAIDKENEYHIFHTSPLAVGAFGINQKNILFHQLRPTYRLVSLPLIFPWLLKKYKIDFYHATYAPAPSCNTPYVFTHHCFSNFKHPEFYPWSIRLRLEPLINKGIRKSSRVICVSRNVLDLTVDHFNIDPYKFRVIHHGVDTLFTPRNINESHEFAAKNLGINSPYILVVGKLELRKNLQRTLEAFSLFLQKVNEPIKLVLVGKRTWHNSVLDSTISRLGLRDHVIETGYINQEQLNWLYSGAQMYVFTSLWEGFGMPILEAMSSGVPVISSNIASIPEVAGDAAILVDPYSVEAIVDAMIQVHGDAELRTQLKKLGIERAAEFSWDKAARETLEVYREMYALSKTNMPS